MHPVLQTIRNTYKDERILAISHVEEAFNEGELNGISPDAMAQAAIFAALCEMVALYGEAETASFCETLASNVKNGHYSLEKSLH
jgi:hypothetical protein